MLHCLHQISAEAHTRGLLQTMSLSSPHPKIAKNATTTPNDPLYHPISARVPALKLPALTNGANVGVTVPERESAVRDVGVTPAARVGEGPTDSTVIDIDGRGGAFAQADAATRQTRKKGRWNVNDAR